MTEFTTRFNDKEITFTDLGIRYDNKAFIKYEDMEDITFRTGAESAIIFRYKGHLVKMCYNPEDEAAVKERLVMPEPEPVQEEEKKPKKGLIIGIMVAITVVAIAAILFLF